MTTGRLPLLLLAFLVAIVPARATPLDKDTCTRLRAEQEQLENTGVERNMEKGPAWAKANLAPEKLTQVKRFIELEEQIVFRCRAKSLVTLAPDPELAQPAANGGAQGGAQGGQAKGDDDDSDEEAAETAKAGPKPGAKAQLKQKAKPAAQSARIAAQPGTTVKRKAPAKAVPGQTDIEKTPPKQKVDDAFKRPAPDPSVNPFAGKLGPAAD